VAHNLADSVERVFFGGVTIRVLADKAPPTSVSWDGNDVPFSTKVIEGHTYALFDVPLRRTATHVTVQY